MNNIKMVAPCLFGIESKTPILTAEAAKADFTNEGGFNDTVRFLKNIIGLWLINICPRIWTEFCIWT